MPLLGAFLFLSPSFSEPNLPVPGRGSKIGITPFSEELNWKPFLSPAVGRRQCRNLGFGLLSGELRVEAQYLLYHPILLLRRQLRIHWQGYDFSRDFLAHRKVSRLVSPTLIRPLQVQWNRIVYTRADTRLSKMRHQAFPGIGPDHI